MQRTGRFAARMRARRQSQRITENYRRVFKRNPVLPAISCRLGRISFEMHKAMLRRDSLRINVVTARIPSITLDEAAES